MFARDESRYPVEPVLVRDDGENEKEDRRESKSI